MQSDSAETPKVGYLGQGGGSCSASSTQENSHVPNNMAQFKLLSPTSAAELVHRSRTNSYAESAEDEEVSDDIDRDTDDNTDEIGLLLEVRDGISFAS